MVVKMPIAIALNDIKISNHSRTVVVNRSSDWGNPFIMRSEADRDRVCDLFEAYALSQLKGEGHE